MYVEHDWVLESFAIGRHPLIPGDGLSLFDNLFDISVQPASGLGSGEVSERRSRVANAIFGEGVDEDYEGGGKKREGEKPKHLGRRLDLRVEVTRVYITGSRFPGAELTELQLG